MPQAHVGKVRFDASTHRYYVRAREGRRGIGAGSAVAFAGTRGICPRKRIGMEWSHRPIPTAGDNTTEAT